MVSNTDEMRTARLDADIAAQRSELAQKDRPSARRLFNTAEAPVPPFLYKYAGSSHPSVRSLLVDSEFYMASHRQFNDPFEFAAKVEIPADTADLERVLVVRLVNGGAPLHTAVVQARAAIERGDAGEIHQRALEQAAASLGVCCLSAQSKNLAERRLTSPRHPLMWAHYANAHKGICLQFHTTRDPGFFGEFQPMDYSDDFVRLPLDVDRALRAMQLKRLLYKKSTAWAYEHEFRRLMEGRAAKLVKFRAASLVGVILGARCKGKDLREVLDALTFRRLAGQPPVRVFRCQLHDSAYRLNVFRARDVEQQAYSI